MIKVNNLNKIYNKNKPNQIHVINNISLEFENTGLVCLLGPSGSGKTTLLNAIGGLDKVDNGSIEYHEDKLDKYKSNEWDFIRNKNVGYIFQNYNLLLNLTVYENVMFTLKMTNLTEEEAHERVMYALQAVGIEKYFKRKVTQLSGGQQQRVAIARALAKSPNVIIADEPTGNLDEKNTTMIMNILKQISKSTLVLLVTHEERIAKFYASRIIRLQDGKIINDEVNNNIYLQDLNKVNTSTDDVNINYFYDKDKTKVEFNIIYKNNVLYIEPLGNKKIEVLSSSDEMKVIDDKKPVLDLETVEEVNYDLDKIGSEHYKKKSNIKYKDSFKMAFKRILEMKKRQKLVFLGFLLSAFLFVFASSTLYSSLVINDKDFIRSGYNEYYFDLKKGSQDEFYNALANNPVGIVVNRSLSLDYEGFDQAEGETFSINSWSTSYDFKDKITTKEIMLGEYGDHTGILIDKMILDENLKSAYYINIGFESYEDFIGMKVNNGEMYIAGVVDKGTPSIYMTYTSLCEFRIQIDFASRRRLVALDTDLNLNINKGYVYIDDKDIPIGEEIQLYEETYIVAGYNDNYEFVLSKDDFINAYYDYLRIHGNSYMNNLYAFNKEETAEFFYENRDLFYYYYNVFDQDKIDYKEMVLYTSVVLLIASAVFVTTSLVFLYFIMRSSLISRVYDIGVYRALGITKKDIRKIFSSEIFIISLFSSFIGYILSLIMIYKLGDYMGLNLPYYCAFLVLILIFGLNILVGLKPINSLLKLTPSEIGSKYDI